MSDGDTQKSASPPAPAEKLDDAEKDQAAQHAAPTAVVIHEIVRHDGEEELRRRPSAILWSGLAAGLSMGFSFLTMALIQSALPETASRRLLDSAGYAVGFVIVILGRQALFTESTLTAALPILVRRNGETFLAMLRFWGLVLAANIAGTLLFALLLSASDVFPDEVRQALARISLESVHGAFWPTLIKSTLAGWLIALMVWMLPSAKSARLLVILLLTYVVAVGRFSHIIAGSVEGFYALVTGAATPHDYLYGFFAPTILGNTIGGVALTAILNHAPLAPELREGEE